MITVCAILTCCKSPNSLYGNTLVFDTLRLGYPDAEVHVFDNASLPSMRHEIRQRAVECGAAFHQIESEVPHDKFIRWAIGITTPGKTLVFLDPDVVFWKKVEFEQRALMMGRRIPAFMDDYSRTFTHPRLHTSFLSIVDPQALKCEIEQLEIRWFELDAIASVMFPANGRMERYDTFGVFYALKNDLCQAFGEEELDCYDHLFCGTHLDIVAPRMEDPSILVDAHEAAKYEPAALKGLWRRQEQHFLARASGDAIERLR
jgi:hypothetical protein